MNWFTELVDGLGNIIGHMFRWLFLLITQILYPLISRTYNLFEVLSRGRLLDNDTIKVVSDRVGLLLGVVMFFIVIVNVIQMLVDPDKVNDKEKGAGKILIRVVLVLVMFGTSSFIFKTLYYVQDVIIDSNVIGRILTPNELNTEDFGDYLSYELFTSFYIINPAFVNEIDSGGGVSVCKKIIDEDLKRDVYESQNYSVADECLGEMYDGKFIIEFNWLLMIIAGGICIYFLVGYCISVGVRMIQLTFLEIIAPMAIVSYLSPKKDNLFTRWLGIYFGTFVDVFIRIAIINFAVYLITLILDSMESGSIFYNTVVDNARNESMLYLILIFAILSFAKKAPDLIKNLFPVTSKAGMDYGVGGAGAFFASLAGVGIAGASRVAALPGALKKGKEDWDGATGFWGKNGKGAVLGKNLLSGLGAGAAVLGGAYVGGKAGMGKKGLEAIKAGQQAQAKANLDRAQRIASGTSYGEYLKSNLKKNVGIETGFAQDEREIKLLSDYAGLQSTIEGYADNNSSIKRLKRDYEAIQQSGRLRGETDEHYTRRIEAARKKYVTARDTFITEAMSNPNALTAGTLTFEYDDQNSATGKSSATFTIDAAKDGTNIESICAVRDQLNTMLKNNPSIFKGYNNVVNSQTSMDSNTIKANNDIAKRKSTQRQKFGS